MKRVNETTISIYGGYIRTVYVLRVYIADGPFDLDGAGFLK